MANETLRYLKLDYQSQKDALLQRIRERWPQRWNDLLANSIGVVLVDIVAWALATLAFSVNKIAGENYIPTMGLRESAVRVGALTGYQLRGPTPASVACEAVLSTPEGADVTIYKGTLIRTSGTKAIAFEVSADYVIAAGDLAPRSLVATFSPKLSGTNIINTFLRVEEGSSLVTPVDLTLDLSAYIQAGQSLNVLGDTSEESTYVIDSLAQAPESTSAYSQIVLNRPWSGATGRIEAQVSERRIQLVQGQTVTDRFVTSTATSGYAVKLSQSPVIDGSVEVSVNGTPWSQTTAIGVLSEFAEVFKVKTFTTGETAVLFGDGTFGAAVPAEAAVTVTYRVGGGTAGNIELSTINTSVTGLLGTLSSPVSIQVSNSTSVGVGGQDPETLDQARVNIPYHTRTNDRAVTLADYQTIAQLYSSSLYGSVAYARATVRTENALLEGNVVSVYAWTTGPGGGLVPLTGQLKTAVRDYLQTKAVGTDYVQVLDGTARPVPLSFLFKIRPGYSVSTIRDLLLATVSEKINALRPGDALIYSDLVSALDATYGVDNLTLATPSGNLYPSNTTELFTPPQDTYAYALTKSSEGIVTYIGSDDETVTASKYSVQLPIFPLQVWSVKLTLGVNTISIMPYVSQDAEGHLQVQQARLLGENLSTNDSYPSTINLLTGQTTLYVIGAPGDLKMKLITAQGYSSERSVNLYVGYRGDLTQTKRREIRAALKAWGEGFGVGTSIFAQRDSGVSASVVSVADIVAAIPGVDSVTRVALDTPANSENRVTAADYELLRVGAVILNNSVD